MRKWEQFFTFVAPLPIVEWVTPRVWCTPSLRLDCVLQIYVTKFAYCKQCNNSYVFFNNLILIARQNHQPGTLIYIYIWRRIEIKNLTLLSFIEVRRYFCWVKVYNSSTHFADVWESLIYIYRHTLTHIYQAFQWIFWARAINCPCKEVFSQIAWVIYCPP